MIDFFAKFFSSPFFPENHPACGKLDKPTLFFVPSGDIPCSSAIKEIGNRFI
jgi:hypothetical protein